MINMNRVSGKPCCFKPAKSCILNTRQIERPELLQALHDYSYLKDRHYPDKGILKFVGDRYRLSTVERTLLYRGITSAEHRQDILQRLTEQPTDPVIIDGYNVLITLLNYRLGHLVFICTDGLCRDAGSLFGKIRNEELFGECVTELLGYLKSEKKYPSVIYLDSPVSHTRKHLQMLRILAQEAGLPLHAELVRSADEALLLHNSGILATSDTAILKRTVNPILDIPAIIIRKRYGGKLFDLNRYLKRKAE